MELEQDKATQKFPSEEGNEEVGPTQCYSLRMREPDKLSLGSGTSVSEGVIVWESVSEIPMYHWVTDETGDRLQVGTAREK